jgi:hypothetical protein
MRPSGKIQTRVDRPHWPVLLLCSGLVAGCAPLQRLPEAAPIAAPAPPPEPVVVAPPPPPAPAPPPAPPVPAADATDLASRRLLFFHDQLRAMQPNEVLAEVTRLNAQLGSAPPASMPPQALELALALAQLRNNGDLARALGLIDPIVRSTAPELQPWQPIARLLAARVAEQRRLEEQLDRQGQALRESQRNVQQLNEKLEALKAIERSLNNRAPAPAASAAPVQPAPRTP